MKKILIFLLATLFISSPTYAYNYNEPHNIELQEQLETARNKTVQVVAVTEKRFQGTVLALGSGALLDDGYILTNEHVIAGNTSIVVNTYDKKKYDAELITSNEEMDIALLHINDDAEGFLFSKSEIYLGMPIMTVGQPLGLQSWSFSEGTIKNLSQSCKMTNGEPWTAIMTDAQVIKGNSGGPMINGRGELVGIVRAATVDRSFVIPLKDIKEFMTKSLP